ncbi:colicin V processing peptidase. Cysteine peptidase. MEROPS family C39 [Colwellia chukchiensis]|uniref:Colicin V processing peptidase. Cysteine peptidase. MEROPS family C39 n=1 Tax=Colwellia chukchiensis TaxID=641665 RepID=A0A1H7LN59_9GAMM|nr:peptidase domain-containing ABC transporter [Colwellia chukchiensis]SEL00168.1 colicin V processing peptidase. Cysteine peptidase. MEROPS family C39 [Colwellia chukchiensis]
MQTNTKSSSQKLLSYKPTKSIPLVLQSEIAECGLASMAMVASFHGHQLDMPAMRKRFSANLKGMNLQQLIELGDNLGLASRALQCPIDEVHKLATPCILHWDLNHFVVLTKVSGKGKASKYSINDPAIGKRTLSLEEFSQHFTGICLELTPTSKFEVKEERAQMKFTQLWSSMSGLKAGLFKLIALSLVLQLFALMTPYYMQWVVDEVLISFDKPLLMVLAIGFALIAIISVVTNAVRSWLILRLSSLLNMQMGVNLLRHLLRLPMNYFESRHIGDIVSRFGSLAQIRERITTGFVETLVDGLMAITVLIMMLIYSVKLTAVVLGAITLYTLVRLALYRPLHQATEEMIQNSAKEQSNFLENIRGMQTIKLFGNESQRQGIWQNRYAEVINSEIRLGRLNISFDSFNKLLFGLENVLVIYFAAIMVMANTLSVGMVLAFIAYKGQLTERFANLIEQIIQFKMMRLHLDRIADIALTEQEANREGEASFSNNEGQQPKGQLTLENICFSYSDEQAPILHNVNLTLEAGESIAITGPSGAGKTTLMKIMLGLLQPSSGKILLDGKDITQIGLKNYRKHIAAVMQDDTLLAGSIADNISFFDPQPNYLKVEQCAHLAAMHDDINNMIMGYNSLVGDMGSNLSGGQMQRLLLARALYQSPCVLFMDEATSHLDKDNEAKISEQIQHLPMTRIMIAHRQETISMAEQVYLLNNGTLVKLNDKRIDVAG